MAICAGDDVFGIDAKKLSDWSCSGCIIIILERHVDMWVMGKCIPFQTEMVKEESMEGLDHVCIVHFSRFSTIINYVNCILSCKYFFVSAGESKPYTPTYIVQERQQFCRNYLPGNSYLGQFLTFAQQSLIRKEDNALEDNLLWCEM